MRIRKHIEEPFGWMKTIAAAASSATSAENATGPWFKINAAVYNLIRITALDAATAT